ncbi:MAG: serine/threonine-protein kinase [Kofleriaceae bacterium]
MSSAGPSGKLESGQTLGRYFILAELGAGGMGRVFSAYDSELDRRVAIKLLHAGVTSDPAKAEEHTVRLDADGVERNLERERILVEARAMARISHPNLVSVYEVGEVDDRVFLVMEYITGVTLATWLHERRRSLLDLVRVFLEIGRGLAAVHRAGMVHGDIKPNNVLVEPSGRARLIDFGVAHTAANAATEEDEGPAVLSLHGAPVVGTRRYLAPERLARKPADARADQYAFAVMSAEALEHALGGLPRWLQPCMVRARAEDPTKRFPSMEVLLAELARRRIARRRIFIAAIAAVALAAALFIGQRTRDALAPTCDGGEERIVGVWDPAMEASARAALAASAPTQTVAAHQTLARLTRYREDWLAHYRRACQATRVGAQSGELLDRKMACLDRHLAGLRQAASLLQEPDGLARVAEIAAGLAPLASCDEAEALLAAVPLPKDRQQRALVQLVDGELATAEVDYRAGRVDEALRAGRAALERTRSLPYPPVRARAGLLVGRALEDAGHLAEAEESLVAALEAAIHGRDERLSAAIAVELVGVIGAQPHRAADARLLGRLVNAALSSAGLPMVELRRHERGAWSHEPGRGAGARTVSEEGRPAGTPRGASEGAPLAN